MTERGFCKFYAPVFPEGSALNRILSSYPNAGDSGTKPHGLEDKTENGRRGEYYEIRYRINLCRRLHYRVQLFATVVANLLDSGENGDE